MYDNTLSHPVLFLLRPATAGPRYRAWKTWLLQKYEEDALREEQEQRDVPRKQRSARAFKRWLARKYKEEADRSDSESDEDSDHEEENNIAFEKWLKGKEEYFKKLQKAKKEGPPRPGGKLTVFQIGCTDETKIQPPDFNSYMRSNQRWHGKKKQFDEWKERKGYTNKEEEKVSQKDIDLMREKLLLDGCTYGEWMGLKQRERKAAKLNVTAFGDTSPRKW